MINVKMNKYNDILLNNLVGGKFKFSFSEYVKSQIHMNILAKSKGRSLIPYGSTLKYLGGVGRYHSHVEDCLRYFYEDLLDFSKRQILLGNHDTYFEVEVEDPLNQFLDSKMDLGEIQEELRRYLSGDIDSNYVFAGIISDFSLDEFDKLRSSKLLAIAAVLRQARDLETTYRLKWEWR